MHTSKNHVYIFDTTLRDGEQAPGASMTIPQKVRIAHQLARLNVDIIEAGFPISSPAQFEAVQRIVEEIDTSVICALSRAKEGDVRSAGQALAKGNNTRIHTFIATSDIHIDAKFGHERYGHTLAEKRKSIIRMTQDAVAYARTFTDNVEFSTEDAGRTEIPYLCEVIQAAIEAGATTINIPDTTGYCIPSEYAAMFESVIDACQDYEGVIFSTHCHDDLGLAVANSIAGVVAGARQIECTINGIGERAGNASLEEVVMALKVRSEHFGLDTGINTRELTPASRMVSVACSFPVPPNKAIVGANAFSHEAGIHQHGVLKRRDTYEIMQAEDVGQEPEQIRLGRHSGRHGFFSRLEKLGLHVVDEQRESLYTSFVALADRKKEIYDEDLYQLVDATEEREMTPYYHLEEIAVSVQTNKRPSATVNVCHLRTSLAHEATGTGDGPVDALFRAIDQAVGASHELVSYSIRSISEGADAFGEVTVLISFGEASFRGVARNTDVLQASADAYIEALNRMQSFVAEEENVAFVGSGIMQSFQGGFA